MGKSVFCKPIPRDVDCCQSRYGWTKSISHHGSETLEGFDSPANTINQWFQPWLQSRRWISSIHSGLDVEKSVRKEFMKYGCGSKLMGSHFGVGASTAHFRIPILVVGLDRRFTASRRGYDLALDFGPMAISTPEKGARSVSRFCFCFSADRPFFFFSPSGISKVSASADPRVV